MTRVATAEDAATRAGGGADSAPTAELRAWTEAYGPELEAHLRRMLGNADDAQDVLQEVWITAYRKPPEDGPDSNVRAWLYRVATNAALDRLATTRRRRAALDGRGHELKPEARPSPEERLDGLSEAARARVRERLAALPRKQRDAVWLRWIEGAEYDAIAHALGSSRESARANVYQGLKRLRAELFDVWKEVAAP